MEYIGTIELQDKNGEYHNWEVCRDKWELVFGTVCNVGLIEDGRMKMEEGESVDLALSELTSDLQVSIDDGPDYVSRVTFPASLVLRRSF